MSGRGAGSGGAGPGGAGPGGAGFGGNGASGARPDASPKPLRLVLASANPDKVKEIAAILSASLDVELLSRPAEVPEVIEDGETLLDNARLKARALSVATGEAAVADDTGLEVDALGGAPGVYSARYAGEQATYADNVAKLLDELAVSRSGDEGDGCGHDQARQGRFRTVALVAFPDGSELWAEGVVEGSIAESPRGSQGFGYDPVFVADGAEGGDGRTFAEMSAGDKERVSHRGRAFRALAKLVAERASA